MAFILLEIQGVGRGGTCSCLRTRPKYNHQNLRTKAKLVIPVLRQRTTQPSTSQPFWIYARFRKMADSISKQQGRWIQRKRSKHDLKPLHTHACAKEHTHKYTHSLIGAHSSLLTTPAHTKRFRMK